MASVTVGGKYSYLYNDSLGQGAFAEVFKGKIIKTGEIVAIKAIKKSVL
jgi:serine/threonine protein kinase